jgi:hypothetical protein
MLHYMLKRFLYLDTDALADYVSALEDGSRESLERKEGNNSSISTSFADTPQAQFERLVRLAKSDPGLAGWKESENGEFDFLTTENRSLVDIECDIYVPEIVKAFSPDGGLVAALDQLDAILPFASFFDENATEGLPTREQRDVMKGFVGALGGKLIAVGELDSSDWKVAGQLAPEYIKGDVEGNARIVGKVASRWGEKQWKPLLALPGSSLMPRDQRRQLERSKPKPGEEGNYLPGPAIMLDVLAIYR